MVIKLRTKRPDPLLKQIVTALREYEAAHPDAEIEAYRQNSVSVRIRVINPEFEGRSRAQREDDLWAVLNELPEEAVAEISLLLLLTPDEAKSHSLVSSSTTPSPPSCEPTGTKGEWSRGRSEKWKTRNSSRR